MLLVLCYSRCALINQHSAVFFIHYRVESWLPTCHCSTPARRSNGWTGEKPCSKSQLISFLQFTLRYADLILSIYHTFSSHCREKWDTCVNDVFSLGSALAQLLPPLSKHGAVRTSFGRGAGEIPKGTASVIYWEKKKKKARGGDATHPFYSCLIKYDLVIQR